MTETPWARLSRIVTARRERLGLPQDLRSVGGPSRETVRKLPKYTEPPSIRMRKSLDELDVALGWPAGTSWRLARDPLEGLSEDVLRDQEEELVSLEGPTPGVSEFEQDVRVFGLLVQASLRNMPREDAERTMQTIGRILGID